MFKFEYIYMLLPKLRWFLIFNLVVLDYNFDPEVFLASINYAVICLILINTLYAILLTVSINEKVYCVVKTLVLTEKKDLELYGVLNFFFYYLYKKVLILFYVWNLLRVVKKCLMLKHAKIINKLKKEWYSILKNIEITIIKSLIITNYYSYIINKNQKFYKYFNRVWRSGEKELIRNLYLVKKIDSYSFYKWVVLIYEDWILKIK